MRQGAAHHMRIGGCCAADDGSGFFRWAFQFSSMGPRADLDILLAAQGFGSLFCDLQAALLRGTFFSAPRCDGGTGGAPGGGGGGALGGGGGALGGGGGGATSIGALIGSGNSHAWPSSSSSATLCKATWPSLSE